MASLWGSILIPILGRGNSQKVCHLLMSHTQPESELRTGLTPDSHAYVVTPDHPSWHDKWNETLNLTSVKPCLREHPKIIKMDFKLGTFSHFLKKSRFCAMTAKCCSVSQSSQLLCFPPDRYLSNELRSSARQLESFSSWQVLLKSDIKSHTFKTNTVFNIRFLFSRPQTSRWHTELLPVFSFWLLMHCNSRKLLLKSYILLSHCLPPLLCQWCQPQSLVSPICPQAPLHFHFCCPILLGRCSP